MGDSVSYRLGVDIGGTFTDIVLMLPDGSMTTRKVPSTPADYSLGIVECLTGLLAEYDLSGDAIDEIVHGTTVATNTIMEYTGARTALLTTAGFRDVLELRRMGAVSQPTTCSRIKRRKLTQVHQRGAHPTSVQESRCSTQGVLRKKITSSLLNGVRPLQRRRI